MFTFRGYLSVYDNIGSPERALKYYYTIIIYIGTSINKIFLYQ